MTARVLYMLVFLQIVTHSSSETVDEQPIGKMVMEKVTVAFDDRTSSS